MSLIEIDHISFSYKVQKQSHNVFNNLSFHLEEGENLGIIGANGVGKSTLMKLLVGILEDYEGKIRIKDLPIDKKHLKEIRSKIGYIFQDSNHQLFMPTVYDDVSFGPGNYGLSPEEVKERTMKALEQVNITHLKDRPIYQLSGGEKKLASIATVLSMGVELILFDEPSVALDPQNRRRLIHILNDLPVSKIIASHDLDFIYDTCERTILLSKGQIIADGHTQDILSDKTLLEENGLELPLSLSRM